MKLSILSLLLLVLVTLSSLPRAVLAADKAAGQDAGAGDDEEGGHLIQYDDEGNLLPDPDDFVCYKNEDCQNDGICLTGLEPGKEGGFCSCPPEFQAKPDCSESGGIKVKGCELDCKNGAVCGVNQFASDDPTMSKFMCFCTNGWTGDLCNIKSETCQDDVTQCTNNTHCHYSNNPSLPSQLWYCACDKGDKRHTFCKNLAKKNVKYFATNAAVLGGSYTPTKQELKDEGGDLSVGLFVGVVVVAFVVGLVLSYFCCRRRRSSSTPVEVIKPTVSSAPTFTDASPSGDDDQII
jgi:hypothetical protein